MDEFIRHLWLHGTEQAASEFLVFVILLLMATGAILRSRLFVVRNMDGMAAAVVVALICNALLLLSAIMPGSPLLGVTGRIFPSPWIHGFFQSLCFEAMLVALVFGLVSGTVSSVRHIIELFTYGISRWPWVIIMAMLVSFLINF